MSSTDLQTGAGRSDYPLWAVAFAGVLLAASLRRRRERNISAGDKDARIGNRDDDEDDRGRLHHRVGAPSRRSPSHKGLSCP